MSTVSYVMPVEFQGNQHSVVLQEKKSILVISGQ